jgi:hypothetical protein
MRRPRRSLLDQHHLCPNRSVVQPRFGKALAVNRYGFTRRRRCGSAFPKREELGRSAEKRRARFSDLFHMAMVRAATPPHHIEAQEPLLETGVLHSKFDGVPHIELR